MGTFFGKPTPKSNLSQRDSRGDTTTPNDGGNSAKKTTKYKFRIFTIGDLGAGKTSLSLKFLGHDFKENSVPDYTLLNKATKSLDVGSAHCVLSFLDTGGQERFKTLTNSSYQNAHIIMVCFDISARESFENTSTWFTEALFNNDQCIVVLVGTKVDLVADRQVTTDEANALCKSKCKNGGFYIETSSKSGHQVDYLLQKSCEELIKLIDEGLIEVASLSEG